MMLTADAIILHFSVSLETLINGIKSLQKWDMNNYYVSWFDFHVIMPSSTV